MDARNLLTDLEDRYGFLFLLLLLDIVLLLALPVAAWSRMLQAVVIAATMLVAFHASRASARVTRFATIGATTAVVLVALTNLTDNPRLQGAAYLLNAVLLLVAIPTIVARVARADTVTGRMVLGGISVYLLIGLLFSYLFLGYSALSNEPFFVQQGPHSPNDYVYFSYITMATVGYGDLTPRGDVGRMLAVIDALLGQIFLVTAVARLVAAWQPRGLDQS